MREGEEGRERERERRIERGGRGRGREQCFIKEYVLFI